MIQYYINRISGQLYKTEGTKLYIHMFNNKWLLSNFGGWSGIGRSMFREATDQEVFLEIL